MGVNNLKDIYLADVLNVMEGSLIKGNLNTIVEGAAYGLWDVKRDNTMYIHLDKGKIKDLHSLKNFKNMIYVSETPEVFFSLGDDITIIKVTSIREAYWKFVDYYRSLFSIPVIGVTGTCGKSTTTEMIKHILSRRYNVCGTRNGNNALAFDFSYLLGIDDTTEVAVFEMGVDCPGDLTYSCRHFKPQIRVLLNIGVYHILGCKTLEGYVKAKAELLDTLDPVNGVLILNAEDENIKKIDVSKFKKVIYFGVSEEAQLKASDIKTIQDGITFILRYKGKHYRVILPGLGKHNAYNAMAAIAAVTEVGMDINEAIQGLKTYKPMAMHLEIREGPKGCTILDDNWNNTPPAMLAALEVLQEFGQAKAKVAVFGQMYNLGTGPLADKQYEEMGKKVVETGVDILVVIGHIPKEIGRKALELGMAKDKVIFIENGAKAFNILAPYLNDNVVLLLKACEDNVTI